MSTRPEFSQLFFGSSDPRYEVRDNPEKFLQSFVDPNNSVSEIASGKLTLILGPKGTGKTALAYYMERTSGDQTKYFARMRDAQQIPLAEVPQIDTGQEFGRNRTSTTWKFILLANYLDVVLEDKGVHFRNIKDARRILGVLRKAGFIAGGSPGSSLLKMHEHTFVLPKSDASPIFRELGDRNVTIYNLIPWLNKWAIEARSNLRHILLLDGLDSIFLNDPRYNESLSGLIQASFDINNELYDRNASGSIALLIRNDVFSRVSLLLPDAHKMRDAAYDLDWRNFSGRGGLQGPLITLVNEKARQGVPEHHKIQVLDYFPEFLGTRKGRSRKGTARLRYLTNLTRHTPRDFLQLMEYIRREAERRSGLSSGILSKDAVHEGVVAYSSKYFVTAIRGELAGYRDGPEIIEKSLTALKLLRSNEFSRSDYLESLKTHSPEIAERGDEFLDLFFKAGALGNLFASEGSRDLVFYHRRDDVELDHTGTLKLHNALAHAWSRSGSGRHGG